jgi:hypothetical protein
MARITETNYRNVIGFQSRIILFPDGVARHITLSKWEWGVYDRTHKESGSDYLPEGAYHHALCFWFQDSFNDAARPSRRLSDRLATMRANAADITSAHHLPPGRARFEARLRRSLARMIAVNMPEATGCADPANDEFSS